MSIKASMVCPPNNRTSQPGKYCGCFFCESKIFVADGAVDKIIAQSTTKIAPEDVTFICMDCALKAMNAGVVAKTEIIQPSHKELDDLIKKVTGNSEEEDYTKFSDKH